jgi:3-oxoacyl-[acyl-carrier protein] reductase
VTRRALIGGGSRGIGFAAARGLAREGVDVVLLARPGAALTDAVRTLRADGRKASALPADLDDLPALDDALATALSDGPFDILVHNTGGPAGGPLLDAPDDVLRAAFSRHVLAGQHLVRALLPGMRASGFGRIVNVVSTSVREPIAGLGVSNVIRGAIASWAKTLSMELPPGITINNVLPGFTDTDRLRELAAGRAARLGRSVGEVLADWAAAVPEGRLLDAEEVAAAIVFLCGDAASGIRGASLPVDAGRLRSI